ncbi:hypothetical protein B0I35DRAFT_413378 [Stachybotrys elegans]|uniref:Uncharacterized protein n=1 Tax=Stachybotrys elegans TaxID=80388 RepID=A0A8K0SLA5_9HYPO|nr:hypothetical protein B0I35DRAFT_413378 [Stachybotrys elegans]
MAADNVPDICLDIAVDHRIKRLCQPVYLPPTSNSTHVSLIENRGRSLNLGRNEIQVTAQLAGPATKGGIAVMLQQPRDNHPFNKGLDAVIEDCKSLAALDEVFKFVSCQTLDIRENVTLVDLLPYTSKQAGYADLRSSFDSATDIICAKSPTVLLCAGKIWLERTSKFDDRKGEAYKLESIGVGNRFGDLSKWPVNIMIRRRDRGFTQFERVNGFHPSLAVNHKPHVSLLRQLQILTVAEACSMLENDWYEETWMSHIRARCKNLGEQGSPSSPGRGSDRQRSPSFFSDYAELYIEELDRLTTAVQSLTSRSINKSASSTYDALLKSEISEKCNNSSLILRQMRRLEISGWPESVAWKNEAALDDTVEKTVEVSRNVSSLAKAIGSETSSIIRRGMKHLAASVARSGGGYDMGLDEAADALLDLAVAVEKHLGQLLEDKGEETAIPDLELSSLMSQMTIAQEASPRRSRLSKIFG